MQQFGVLCEGKDYLHVWKVTDVAFQRRISYQWRYEGYPGDSSVTWEISERSDGTRLNLTHEGHETIQGDPIFSRESCVAGWTYFIHDSLKAFLEGHDS